MFDKLIESEPEGADFKNRRSYFMVSSLVVGALFVTAVVISIYAADFGLGHDSLELVEMIGPVPPATEVPQPRLPATASQSQSQMASRKVNMIRIDESPLVPSSISVVPNQQLSRLPGLVTLGSIDSGPAGTGSSGRGNMESGTDGGGLATTSPTVENATVPEPPPIKKDPPVKRIVSEGVINGKATYLPVPAYPAAAKTVGAFGKVDVQVLIDESGKVISANAVSGSALLKGAAERAAWGAKFSPTYLSKVPVKVTGVIVYNFTR